MAVMHHPMKFGAHIFIQSGIIDIFSKIKDGGGRHLGFGWVSHHPWDHPRSLIRGAYLLLSRLYLVPFL